MQRTVFYISDGTGITAETLGHSLLTQFEELSFKQVRIPFVDTKDKALAAVEQINAATERDSGRAIVFNTVVDPGIRELLATSDALVLDLFAAFLGALEAELNTKRSLKVGKAHGMVNYASYERRIDAMNYSLRHDDGADTNFGDADVVLIGVSRSGKTPTCLYLAMHYGVRTANYPLTEDELSESQLPKWLRGYRSKLFGLTIDAERLHQIREARRPSSRYSALRQCQREVAAAESMFRRERLSFLSTTYTSIEEAASRILLSMGLERELH